MLRSSSMKLFIALLFINTTMLLADSGQGPFNASEYVTKSIMLLTSAKLNCEQTTDCTLISLPNGCGAKLDNFATSLDNRYLDVIKSLAVQHSEILRLAPILGICIYVSPFTALCEQGVCVVQGKHYSLTPLTP